jgi:hypothetical protein
MIWHTTEPTDGSRRESTVTFPPDYAEARLRGHRGSPQSRRDRPGPVQSRRARKHRTVRGRTVPWLRTSPLKRKVRRAAFRHHACGGRSAWRRSRCADGAVLLHPEPTRRSSDFSHMHTYPVALSPRLSGRLACHQGKQCSTCWSSRSTAVVRLLRGHAGRSCRISIDLRCDIGPGPEPWPPPCQRPAPSQWGSAVTGTDWCHSSGRELRREGPRQVRSESGLLLGQYRGP